MREVLNGLSIDEARQRPGRFFEMWFQRGGLLFLNHPLAVPLESGPSIARADLSWRHIVRGEPVPADIAAIERLAVGYEAYNLTVTHLRDRYLVGDTDATLLATLNRFDRFTAETRRPMVPVGGSDSHSFHLRPMTYVLVEGTDQDAIRAGFRAGRVCVRDPAACSFEARDPAVTGSSWNPPGTRFAGVREIAVRADGDDSDLIRGGEVVAHLRSGEELRVAVPRASCTAIRVRVGKGFSAPVFANCG